jgi:uncharacterized membrane protein (UPF0127 family)
MDKFDKLRLALILQDIEALYSGNQIQSIASTAGTLMANIDEDGFDKEDIAKLMVDQVADNGNTPEGLMFKIKNNIALNYELLTEEFTKVGDEAGLQALQTGDLKTLYQSIKALVYKNRKLKEGGTVEDDSENITTVRIGKKSFRVIVAETEQEKEIGLSDTAEMDDDEGMLFIYEEPQHLDFWMKDCDLTLSIIFLDEEKTVISNQKGLPNTEDFISADNAKYVLEVNYTEEIQPGDKVVFNLGEELEMEPDKLYVLAEDGSIQGQCEPGVRIFSRKSTSVMIRKAKKADESKSDVDYKDLGRYVFGELDRQENRDPEYVEE